MICRGTPQFLAIDIESNGLHSKGQPADAPGSPRIAEIDVIPLDKGLTPIGVSHNYILPDGWRMTPGSTAVNGITDEMLREQGVPIREALEDFYHLLNGNTILVAFNVTFDAKMLRGEFRRAMMDDRREQTPCLCTRQMAIDYLELSNFTKGTRLHDVIHLLRIDDEKIRKSMIGARRDNELNQAIFRDLVLNKGYQLPKPFIIASKAHHVPTMGPSKAWGADERTWGEEDRRELQRLRQPWRGR
jgi:DNA polymerase III epsilon subunit-like protein